MPNEGADSGKPSLKTGASILEDPHGFLESLRGGPYHTILGGLSQQGGFLSGKQGLKAISLTRLQNYVVAGVIIGGLTIVMGPWIVEQTRQLLVFDYELDDPDMMEVLSPVYWTNEWRKGRTNWRWGESGIAKYYQPNFEWAKKITGRDLAKPASWFKKASAAQLPSVLVPLCGDSPIVGDLAKMGYEVDAIDCCDIAINSVVEKTENVVPKRYFRNIHLDYNDFFSPSFWQTIRHRTFDVIYDRQGLTAVSPKDREDYTFLLRRALKPDGVVVIESVYRTPFVPGHKYRGPPFDVAEEEIKRLFPAHDGFTVKCKEVDDSYKKGFDTAEARVLKKAGPEYWTTSFPCVAYRPKGKKE